MQTISLVTENFGVNVTMGASNISFGLPDRKYINSAFLAMAIQAGVTCPITNPLVPEIRKTVLAADLALGRDEFGMSWIGDFWKINNPGTTAKISFATSKERQRIILPLFSSC